MYLDYWHYAETTTSAQPILRENEKDIYVEQNVGLYHGKSKIITKQKGRCYLTSQRIIYIDDKAHSKESVCLELGDIKDLQYNSKFLKRSAKLVIFLKLEAPVDKFDMGLHKAGNKASLISNKVTWTCPICMVTNETTGELKDPMPRCINCGIAADYDMVASTVVATNTDEQTAKLDQVNSCPACTFVNHPQINNCEICGTRLLKSNVIQYADGGIFKDSRMNIVLETNPGLKEGDTPFIQLSFRNSDGSLFFQAMCGVLEDLESEANKLLYNQKLVSINGVNIHPDIISVGDNFNQIGITSLERIKEQQLLKNDILLNNALGDLNNLMALASDIERLYEGAKGDNSKKDSILLIDRDKFLNKSTFLDEISREIHQLIMSEFKDQLKKQDGILINMVDLYALYNKSMRIGTGFVSPSEMREACERFTKLGLMDIRLVRINGRVLCVSSDNSFEFIKKNIVSIVEDAPGSDLLHLTQILNQTNSNNWAIGIIMEVLQNCITEGELLIDEQITGIHYYVNVNWRV
ncbi:ESCRT-II subunit protein VPS36 Ecym_3231 [Eremothecium cymbalariae DBVPG|uniref:Vacuolar protein-sorting-associated protein 36 n=1 Tax=Eremothecium cymbalariae (strain CBS 270.75 / DBVPG 7215 / KCTC 17166 / NRRL Y-17582) TaxID=931890 RepID=G8JRF6_ERECY|nr:Hypothetical protein Ecym_3231 [Eremothecium cymbalariae DBVPG\